MAGPGPALELAIGTGRVALPLAARGVAVEGVDISPEMVARLRAKPGGPAIPVTIGNFVDVPVTGRYRLIFIVLNSLFNVTHQDDLVACFRNMATRLADDGSIVVETFVYDGVRLACRENVRAEGVETDQVVLEVSRRSRSMQTIAESHVILSPKAIRLLPLRTQYAHLGEMDLAAKNAGLRLWERWGDWSRTPFTEGSRRQVSVYRR